MTSSPVYPSVVRIGSPVWIPMRTRAAPPCGHDAVARARWICTAAATAWVARRNTTKNESPWVSTSQPSYAVNAARSRVRCVSSTVGYCSRRYRAREVLFSMSVWSTVRVPLGSSDMDTLLCGRFMLWPLMHHLFATLRRRPPPPRPAEIRPRALAHDREGSGSVRDTSLHRHLRSGSGSALLDTAGVQQGRSQTCTVRLPAARRPAFSPLPQTSPTHQGRSGECT